MFNMNAVTVRRSSNWALRAAMLMFLPAILIVGSNLIANSKNDTQTTSLGKPAIKRAVPAAPAVIFEAGEEFEDDDLVDAHVLLKELPGLHGLFLSQETTHTRLVYHSPYQIEYSLNPRAPPAL